MDDPETLHRRARLRELIRTRFEDKQGNLLAHIRERGYAPNQGELSALTKDHCARSFGDKKARTLAEQIGLGRFWFAAPLGTYLDPIEWKIPDSPPADRPATVKDEAGIANVGKITPAKARWPFSRITPERYFQLMPDERAAIEEKIEQWIEAYEAKSRKETSHVGR